MAISATDKLISLANLSTYHTKIREIIDAVDEKLWVGTTAEYNSSIDSIAEGTIVILTDDTVSASAKVTSSDIDSIITSTP